MINQGKQEEVRKEAKKILDNFANALGKVRIKKKEFKKEIGGYREERNGEDCNNEFRKTMFENAPEKDGDCIIAEKKKW